MPGDAPITVHVVRVFCDERDDHGNALGIVVDGARVPEAGARQELADELGFSETVFLDAAGNVRIFTPATELPFAGHPLVGAAWLLGHLGQPADVLRPPAGEVAVSADAEVAWIDADPSWSPAWELRELPAPDDVDDLDPAAFGIDELVYAWSWQDERAGAVRARSFGPAIGVTEDEATGSAALRLADVLGRRIEIRQGRGSRLCAQPLGHARARVGGRVVLDEALRVDAG